MNNRFAPPIPPQQWGFVFPRSEQEYIEQQNFIREQYERNTGVRINNQSLDSSKIEEISRLQNPYK
ncbi:MULTISPECIES: hypothetical protein [Providencia]|uniref:hypothetical protein n=1 Tax=Providencia TaxID=586 RepID=UPI0008FB4252|nr:MULTISPECIES: hypothetical protein [Providencia]APC12888.1 hypothetical protein RB151_032300 [Providencia rettgeri]UYV42378.1 hypothetical protein NTP67_03745 [Providencia rettgeri]